MIAPALPELKINSTGDAVRVLQRLLMDRSISVPRLFLQVDGKFGTITQSAVKTFQAGRALVQDGIVGTKTWSELSQLPGEM